MFGKAVRNGWKTVSVFGAALATLTSLATTAHALPDLAGRKISVNTTMHHDKSAGVDYTNTLTVNTQDAQGNITGKMVDKFNVIWNVSGKLTPTNQWNNYSFNWQASAPNQAMQFTGVLNAPVPATQYHKVALFATGTYLNQIYYNGKWNTYGPSPISLTAAEYYVYTVPSPVIRANPGAIKVGP